MRRWLPLSLLATGCLSLPAYEPEVAVSFSADQAGTTVAGPGFALHFAGGDRFHFPDALEIDGKDVLGHAAAPGCFDETEAGVLIKPTPRISASTGAEPLMNLLSPVLRGPAVVQVKLEWATKLACNLDRRPGGTSSFTVFLDGRIVRHDVIADPSASELSPGACACAEQTGGFTVSTYWSLARELYRDLFAPEPSALPAATEVLSNRETSCIDGGTHQLGFGWQDFTNTTIRGHDAVIGFGRDLTIDSPTLTTFSWENSSAILLEHNGCTAALDRALEYVYPTPLLVNGEAVMASWRDGMYGGDRGDGAPPGLELATDRAELSGPIPPSFAVWLRFPRAVSALRATLEGAKGAWYVPQRVDDRSWIVWFRDSLSAGQTIAIEPR